MKTSFTFNGGVEFKIEPENESERQIIALAFNGNEVRGIQHSEEGSIVLKLAQADAKKAAAQ